MENYTFPPIGDMEMPADFPHKAVFQRGRPRHEKFDDFWRKHPTMDPAHRAKLFAPFDALRGFDFAVHKKEIAYYNKIVPGEDELCELSRRLSILHACTKTARMARENHVHARVTYFIPCSDEDNFAYGLKGRYETVQGVVAFVDEHAGMLGIGAQKIALSDILAIDAENGLFDIDPESEVS